MSPLLAAPDPTRPVVGVDDVRPLSTAARLASHRLAHLARRVAAGRAGQVPPELRNIVEAHRDFHPKADIALLVRAYEAAERFHAGQMRRSGDPYIVHPIAVTEILAELGVDTTTLVAALLHDTVEDTGATLELLAEQFGAEVANLVDGVTKLDKMRFGEAAEAETLRKLIVALARDYRVLVIKIADRLHNMRTLGYMSPAKQAKISRVTLEILAPLAHRLGVSVIKRELEDRAFAVLRPADQQRTKLLVDDFTAAERESGQLAAMVARLRSGLAEAKIPAQVSIRTSHLFSIYKREQERGRPPRDYYDIVRVLVLVNDVTDCYAALGVIHGLWRPVPGRLRDFLATPKFNMYQSLHTTVTDNTGRAVDIQIRTPAMHRLAETGIVARPVGPGADGARLDGLAWLHSLLDWQGEAKDPREFLESLSSDLDADEVLAFTPKGKAIALPARSSPVDVAYAVHTDIGHRAIGARVNGRLVPLHTRLRNGDVVEILTSNQPHAGPSEDWLTFVKTARARVRIRRRLARTRREAEQAAAEQQAATEQAAGREPAEQPVNGQTARRAAARPAQEALAIADTETGPLAGAGAPTAPAAEQADRLASARQSARAAVAGAMAAEPARAEAGNDAAVLTGAAATAAGTGQAQRDAGQEPSSTETAVPAAASALARSAALARAGAATVADREQAAVSVGVAVVSAPPAAAPSAPPASRPAAGGPADSGSPAGRRGPADNSGRRPAPAWAGTAVVEGYAEAPVRIARCCLPLPGDEIIGFVTQHNTHHRAVTLHRTECVNSRASRRSRAPGRVVSWTYPPEHAFPAQIAVEAFDRYGLLADITEVLADTATSLRAASTSTSQDRVAHARFTVEVTGPDQLERVLAAVRTVGGVYDCYRANQTAAS
ncbi:MAG: RelA/SpoT family protein [Frankia sp.]|nr:RelA/SpoT family protein [Frankia sp.]